MTASTCERCLLLRPLARLVGVRLPGDGNALVCVYCLRTADVPFVWLHPAEWAGGQSRETQEWLEALGWGAAWDEWLTSVVDGPPGDGSLLLAPAIREALG